MVQATVFYDNLKKRIMFPSIEKIQKSIQSYSPINEVPSYVEDLLVLLSLQISSL